MAFHIQVVRKVMRNFTNSFMKHSPVNKGIFYAIVVHDLQCPLCTSTDIGDEFNNICMCPFFQNERKMYIPNIWGGCSLRPGEVHMDKVCNTTDACQLQ